MDRCDWGSGGRLDPGLGPEGPSPQLQPDPCARRSLRPAHHEELGPDPGSNLHPDERQESHPEVWSYLRRGPAPVQESYLQVEAEKFVEKLNLCTTWARPKLKLAT